MRQVNLPDVEIRFGMGQCMTDTAVRLRGLPKGVDADEPYHYIPAARVAGLVAALEKIRAESAGWWEASETATQALAAYHEGSK